METCHGRVLFLATGILMSAFLPAEGAPLPSYRTGGSEEPAGVSLHLPLALSLTALAALVVVLANCMTCCKERPINFKEFEDNFDDEIDFTPPAEDTPSMQSPAEVYTLAVPPVALPGPPHLQPPSRIAEGSAGVQVARHTLSYIQEIGNGWFGKVLLSEMYSDPAAARVVVKELKANASAKEQNDFLQHGDPYRVLQHPNLLQCLGQCVEAIPFLLVFEYCEMGDLRSYLSQQDWMFRNAELLQLQKMACEIAAGVTHLHKNNFLHSDLALRNCFLTADLTVKVGDYGIGPYRYKEDYIITEDDESAPLRWLAPELVGERHGGVITMEQTKPGNVWALGVTLWELLENAGQPYPHLSDREVLNHVIRELQVKPFKPQLELPYSERWYEVLQFCWLSPDKRATAEEVHRLLTYLRMQGQKDMEEDFEQRWSALKPNPSTRQAAVSDSSFPILEQFAEDSLRPEVDEVLTVTETSRGLSFEYVWEAAKHDHYDGSHGRSAMDTTLNYHSMFFPVPSDEIQAHFPDPAAARAGSTETRGTASRVPDVLPVLDAHKPSNGNEYYIQLEEQGESACEGNETRGSDADTLSDRQEFVVLQDVHLDESSTDADFFHQSIDSKDSLLQDSHIWSSSEHESPYHTNIFSEGDSKQENPQSWEKSFMELPVRNGNPFLQGAPVEAPEAATDKRFGDSFLGDCLEATQRGELSGREGSTDVSRLLNTEKLADNFLFLTENSLIKESSGSSSGNRSPQQDLLSPGLPHTPEESFKMSSWDNLDNLDGAGIAETPLKPAERNTFPRDGLSDLTINFLQPVIQKEILVPSITLVTEPTFDVKTPVGNGSSSEDFDLLNSSDTGIDSAFDSSSGGIDVLTSIADSFPSLTLLGSAPADPLCIDAKPSSFEDLLGSPKDGFQPIGSKQLVDGQVHLSPTNNSRSEGLTTDDLLSELIDNDQEETEAVLSDHDELTVEEEEEEEEEDDALLVKSTLPVSGPSMDRISQDSLLDDSVSTTPPTAENSAETPDSLDSLDIHRLEAHAEDLSAPAAPQKLQPPYKTADSGYETENLESPEWISQPIVKDHSPEENGTSLAEEGEEEIPEELPVTTTLVPPEIIVSEVESIDAEEEEETSEEQPPETPVPGDEPFIGGNYRDSAYFSDNESEPERKSEETNGASAAEGPGLSSSTAQIISGASGSPQSAAGEELDSSLVFQQKHLKSNGTGPADEVETSQALPPAGNGFPELVLSGEEDWDREVSTSTQDGHQDTAPLHLLPDSSSSTEPPASQPSLPLPTSAKPLPENMVHAKLTRTYASDSPKVKESDMEGRYLGRQDGSGADAPEDGMEADEEDENSDDSDEDARAYRLHSSSSESEEDDDTVHPVPVIISDDSSSRNLRSLLKAPALHGQPELPPATPALSPADSSKRAVSFFDDVTVYLFDQETPTKELGDHSSSSNSQVAEFSSPVPTASYLNRFTNSESSTDEEGGGFEWDDDFSSSDGSFMTKGSNDSMASKALSTPAASNYFSPPRSTGRASDTSWNSASSNYSRFSISPASIANFSLTHLTDSDIEQGGDSEDGEKD